MNLSDITFKKFTEVYDISDYEVLTEDGFKEINKFNVTIPYEVYRVTLCNGLYLDCADNHILITESGDEIYAINSVGAILHTETGNAEVISVEWLREAENMYDLEVNSVNHTYYTNGILSHNTTSISSYIVWCLCFKKDFNVGIIANTGDLTSEIVNMIKQMFELLPSFLKPGVKVWNARSISLSNGCRIMSAVAGGSALRGRTINLLLTDECLGYEETITIRDKLTNEIIKIPIGEFYDMLENLNN